VFGCILLGCPAPASRPPAGAMASAARSAAGKKAAETRRQNKLLREAASGGQQQGALRSLLGGASAAPSAARGSSGRPEAPPPAAQVAHSLGPQAANAAEARPEGRRKAPAAPATVAPPQQAAVETGAMVVAERGGPRFAFEDFGAARSVGHRVGRNGVLGAHSEADESASESDVFGAGQAGTPGKRAADADTWLAEGSADDGTEARGQHAPAPKRSKPCGTGVDDIMRWSAQKAPCANSAAKSQKAEGKAAEEGAALDRRATKLLEERFRDFGKADEIRGLTDEDGALLWDAAKAIRGAAARVQDHQVRELRKRFAPAGTAERDLRIRFPEDAWGGPGSLGLAGVSFGSVAPFIPYEVTGGTLGVRLGVVGGRGLARGRIRSCLSAPRGSQDEVPKELLAAIRLSKDPSCDKRSNGDFVAYMSECEGLNQKELVVCLRDVAGNNPLVQPARQEYIAALMECIVRRRLDERFPREVALLKTVWGDCLQEKSPEKVLPACVRLLNSSHLRRSLFHDVAKKGAEGWLKQLMMGVLSGITPPIAQKKMNAADQKVKAEMDRLQVHVLLRGKRPVVVVHRRVDVKCT
ncbi:unnamed protein product, partial [Prorocentrum cordatum]